MAATLHARGWMPGWFSTPLGRALRMVLGLVVLVFGALQVSIIGLCAMLIGLIVTVTAVVPAVAPAVPVSRRPRL